MDRRRLAKRVTQNERGRETKNVNLIESGTDDGLVSSRVVHNHE